MNGKNIGCNWCGSKERSFAVGKPYCTLCEKYCKRECGSCHRPFSDTSKFFEEGSNTCNTCRNKFKRLVHVRKMGDEQKQSSNCSTSDEWSDGQEEDSETKKKTCGVEEIKAALVSVKAPKKKKRTSTATTPAKRGKANMSKKKQKKYAVECFLAMLKDDSLSPSSVSFTVHF
jgi:hypothetical protein